MKRQREDAMTLIKAKGWALYKEYEDNSISASRREKKRPRYDEMRADYEAGRFTVIVCYDLDRLTRQPAQLEQWIEASETQGLRIVTLNGEADLATDAGRLFARIKVSVARSEVERMSARRKRANEQTVASGKPAPGRRPFGWEVDGITIRPTEAAVVREAYASVLAGDSLRKLVREWNGRGVESPQKTPWTAFKLGQLLGRDRNYGALLRYGVEQPKSLIQPIVDRDTHEGAMAIIAGRAQPGRKPEKHLLSGLATCATCGRKLAAKALRANFKDKTTARVPYYICSSRTNRTEPSDGLRHPTISAEMLEARVEGEIVSAFLLGRGVLFPETDGGDLARLHTALQGARAGVQRIVGAIGSGLISEGEATAKLAPLRREELALLAAIDSAQSRIASSRFVDLRVGVFVAGRADLDRAAESRRRIRENYRALSFDDKRQLVSGLLEIRVATGIGPKRATIVHRVVTTLNEP